MTEELNNFFHSLRNFEKSRDKNHFIDYSLSPFDQLVKNYSCKPKISLRISVIGTNGKGSISYFLSKFFQKIGTTGLYTSPHLFSPLERIQVNGECIPENWILEFVNKLNLEKKRELENFSFFEVFTLLSFLFFQERECQFEIYEAGLGGRLDATKIANADIVVLCKVDLDHKEILGDTREKILKEKLGIITDETKFLFYFPHEHLRDEKIYEFSTDLYKNINIIKFNDYIDNYKNYIEFNYKYSKFIFNNIVENEKLRSKFVHSINKDCTFLQISEEYDSENKNHILPGRMEILQNSPMFLFDVAHNPDAILNLCKSLARTYKINEWEIVLGLLPDKDMSSILKIVKNFELFDKIFICNFLPFRMPEEKVEDIQCLNYNEFLNLYNSQKPIVFTGSFRLRSYLDGMIQRK